MSTALVQVPLGDCSVASQGRKPVDRRHWQPTAILVGQAETAPWTRLSDDASTATFYAGSAVLELFRGEASNYRDNLAGDNSLWVILRPRPANFRMSSRGDAPTRPKAKPMQVQVTISSEMLRCPKPCTILSPNSSRSICRTTIHQSGSGDAADPELLAPHRPRNGQQERTS